MRLFLVLSFLVVSVQQFAHAAPQSLSYQGRILDNSQNPLEAPSVVFQFTLLSPDETCELWRETKSAINMTGSGGIFDITIGPSSGLATALENGTAHNCLNPVAPYTGTPTSGRKLKVEFDAGNGFREITPNLDINSVPYANVAAKLGNMTAGDFIARPGTCASGQSVYFDGTNFVCQSLTAGDIPNIDASKITTGTIVRDVSSAIGQFTNLRIFNGSGQYLTMNYPSAGAIDYTIRWPATQGAASTVLQNDGAGNLSWAAAGSGSGDITEVAAGAGLTGGATSGIATLTVDSGLGANKIAVVGGAPLGANGVVVANGMGTALTSLNCTIGQVIKFDISGFATCGSDDSSGLNAVIQGGNSFTAAMTIGTNDTNTLNLETDGTPKVTVLANGNVGVGSVTPNTLLTVAGRAGVGPDSPAYNSGSTFSVQSFNSGANSPWLSINSADSMLSFSTDNSVDGSFIGYQMGSLTFKSQTGVSYGNPSAVGTPRMTLTDTGNVGIGTTEPGALLQVGEPTSSLGTIRLAGNTSGYVQLQPAAAAGSWNMTLPPNDGDPGQVLSTDGSGVTSWTTIAGGSGDITQGGNSFTAPMTIGTNDAQPLSLETNNSPRMTILSNGFVGIGMTNPYSELTVRGNIQTDATGSSSVWAGAGGDYIRMTEGSTAGLTAFKNLMISSGNGAATGSAFTIGFQTGGYDNDPTMTITGGNPGNVGIGATTPSAKLDVADTSTTTSAIIVPRAGNFTGTNVNGMIRYNTDSTLFEFRQNGAWVNYTAVSDGRLKSNVVPVTDGLGIVNQLNPVFYDWDRSNPKASGFEDKHQVGFIAQEVEKVLPEVVNKGEDSYRSLEYGKIVSVVVAAVQELYNKVLGIDRELASVKASKADKTEVDARVQKLESDNAAKDKKINHLEQENAAIKARLERIESALNSK